MDILHLNEYVSINGEKILEITIPHIDESFLGKFLVVRDCCTGDPEVSDKVYYFYFTVVGINEEFDTLRLEPSYYGPFLFSNTFSYTLSLLTTGNLEDPTPSEVNLIKAARNNIDTNYMF